MFGGEGLIKVFKIGWGKGAEIALFGKGHMETVVVDPNIVPKTIVSVEQHAEPTSECRFMKGVGFGGGKGFWCVG